MVKRRRKTEIEQEPAQEQPLEKPEIVLPEKWIICFMAAAIVVLALLVFRPVFQSGAVLLTTDDAIGDLARKKAALPQGFVGWWRDYQLAGLPRVLQMGWTNILLWLLPLEVFADWIHAIDLSLGAFFFAMFLRERGRSVAACLVGALTGYWLASNFTLTFAGHIGKFGVLMFAGLYLWMVERAVVRKSKPYALLAGGAMGAMFLEQPDVALFFSMPLGLYAVYALFREHGWQPRIMIAVLAPLIVATALLAARPVLVARQLFVQGNVVTQRDADPQRRWEYTTQWSWPPEESIDFIAPGFMGWRSNEDDGPYWGRMGRSAGWEETKRGFRNFKLENQYLGAIPIFFALWACWFAFVVKGGERKWRWDMICWSAITLVTLLLSFGKHFPLYRLFYMLPVVSSIRNPNKFLQIFQIALAVLSAAGIDLLFSEAPDQARKKKVRPFLIAIVVVGAVMVLYGVGLAMQRETAVARMAAQGWGGNQGPSIVSHMIRGLLHGGVLTLVLAAVLWISQLTGLGSNRSYRKGAAGFVAVVVVIDILLLAPHYVMAQDIKTIRKNVVAEVLNQRMQQQRVACVSQGSFYSHLLTYVLPFHGIPTINITQLPVMPPEYERFLGMADRNPLRFWQLGAVGCIMGPPGLWGQVQNDPNLKEHFDLVFAYNVAPGPLRALHFLPSTDAQPPHGVILKTKKPYHRFTLVGDWEVLPDDEALERIFSPEHVPAYKVIVAPEHEGLVPESEHTGVAGSVGMKRYRPGGVLLQVTTDRPAILRIADMWTPDWKAVVDGEPVPVIRCDYLFQGVYVDIGLHEVKLEFRPNQWPLFLQVAGMALVAAALVSVVVPRKGQAADVSEPTE